ncbi:hypothetical protein AMTR_s00145p00058920 [Amborella trichopoda]|uniref:Uncharacterized protein n=1 Tax=Amborella trichopoda TaxID=13333 RepID=W1PDA5_AMBTC|nr:hypothetical protein AMTR_s00145p00058920 [Amborella trichopoda]
MLPPVCGWWEGREREKAWQVAVVWAEDMERKDGAKEKRGGGLRLPPALGTDRRRGGVGRGGGLKLQVEKMRTEEGRGSGCRIVVWMNEDSTLVVGDKEGR